MIEKTPAQIATNRPNCTCKNGIESKQGKQTKNKQFFSKNKLHADSLIVYWTIRT